ncbi:MAG: metalloregulator ArsR/SmtB family transcription factor [Anaerolineales bacterium]
MEPFAVQMESNLLKAISHPARLHILTLLKGEEACVCHIQAVVGLRQAAVSQHLMELRRSHLIASRREGSRIYYRVDDPHLSAILQDLQALALAQARKGRLQTKLRLNPRRGRCKCPKCTKPGAQAI